MPTDVKGIDALSDRQKEVLRLTATHLQAKEIARKLNITERTVRAHTEGARKKLGAATSREAVRIFMANDTDAPIVKNDQWPSRPIAETVSVASLSGHEQALYPTTTAQRNHDDQFPPLGNGLADAGSTWQAPAYRGRDRDLENAQSDTWSGESDFQPGSRRRVSDGRWDAFRGRLETSSPLQWLGLVLLVSILFPLILAVLVQSATGALQVLQSLNASAG